MTLGRDWRDALHPDPICEVCAESADLLVWHTTGREPWAHLCNQCFQDRKYKPLLVSTRPVVKP